MGVNDISSVRPAALPVRLVYSQQPSYWYGQETHVPFPQAKVYGEQKAEKPKTEGDGKFSIFTAGKELVKGIFRPIGTMLKHPLLTAGAIAGAVVLASVAPITIPLMVMAGAGFGLYQIGKGASTALRLYREGDYDGAEKAFGDIGEGTFALATSAMAMRSAAAIAAEAKTTTAALKTATTSAEKLNAIDEGIKAATRVKQGTWLNALNENVSLLTSRQGWQATWAQLNPRTLGSGLVAKAKSTAALFKEPPKVNLDSVVKSAQHRLGIADKDMPKIATHFNMVDKAGKPMPVPNGMVAAYNPSTHTLHVQPNGLQLVKDSIRSKVYAARRNPFLPGLPPSADDIAAANKIVGYLDKLPKPLQNFIANSVTRKMPLENLVAHELTHARQYLPVSQLTRQQANAILAKAGSQVKNHPILPREFFLENMKFADDVGNVATLSGKELANAEGALIRFYNGIIANSERAVNPFSSRTIRGYIATPMEMEARREGAAAAVQKALSTLDNPGPIPGPQVQAQVRNYLIEQRLNNAIANAEALKFAGKSADKVALLEQEINALRTLYGTNSMTGIMLKGEAQVKRGEALGQQIREIVQKISDRKF